MNADEMIDNGALETISKESWIEKSHFSTFIYHPM